MASDTKFLDLDALLPVEKVFRFEKVDYPMAPINVGDWLTNMKSVEELSKFQQANEGNPAAVAAANMDLAIATLSRAFPTFPVEKFRTMSMGYLDLILRFAQANDGTDDANAEAANEAAANPTAPPASETTA